MEYQKIINLLDDIPNQPFKFRIKDWFQINYEYGGTYNAGSQIKFKTSIFMSSSCNYSDAYVLANGIITVIEAEADDAA